MNNEHFSSYIIFEVVLSHVVPLVMGFPHIRKDIHHQQFIKFQISCIAGHCSGSGNQQLIVSSTAVQETSYALRQRCQPSCFRCSFIKLLHLFSTRTPPIPAWAVLPLRATKWGAFMLHPIKSSCHFDSISLLRSQCGQCIEAYIFYSKMYASIHIYRLNFKDKDAAFHHATM